MAEGRTDSLLGLFSYGKNRSFQSHIIGRTVVAQAPFSSIYLSLVSEGEIKPQNDMDGSEHITI